MLIIYFISMLIVLAAFFTVVYRKQEDIDFVELIGALAMSVLPVVNTFFIILILFEYARGNTVFNKRKG